MTHEQGQHKEPRWQMTHVYVTEGYFTQQIYWISPQSGLKDSDRLLDMGRAADLPGARLRPGVHAWGKPLRVDIPDISKMCYKRELVGHRYAYKIWYVY